MDEMVRRFDLGVLDEQQPPELLEAGEPAARPRRRRPTAVAILLLVAALAGWRAVDGRGSAETRWLAQVWATRAAYDDARANALTMVTSRAVPGDEVTVATAVAAVDSEEAVAVSRLANRAHERLLVTPEVRRARAEVVAALRAQAADLRTAAREARLGNVDIATFPPALAGSAAVVRRSDARVQELRVRHHLPVAHPTVPRFYTADGAVAALTPLLDVRTGLQLLVTTDTGTGGADTRLVDLDRGTSRALAPVTAGYDIVIVPGRAVSTSGLGTTVVVPFAPGAPEQVVRAPALAVTPDGLWLRDSARTVRFAGFDGHTSGPYAVPAGTRAWSPYPVSGQLFLVDGDPWHPGVTWLWDPRTGLRRQLGSGCSDVLAASGDAVAWSPCTDHARVVVTGIADGRTAVHVLPGRLLATSALLSPSGRRVEVHGAAPAAQNADAICWSDAVGHPLRCAGTYDGTTATSWSGDGRWLLVARRSVLDTQMLLLDTRTGTFHRVRLHSPGPMSAVIVP